MNPRVELVRPPAYSNFAKGTTHSWRKQFWQLAENPPKLRGNSVLLSFPDNQSFIFYRITRSRVEISWRLYVFLVESHSWRWTFEVMARDDWFCTFGGALGTFRRFPDSSRHPRKMVARIYPPPLSLGVCTCAFVCIYLCAGKKKMATTNSAEES